MDEETWDDANRRDLRHSVSVVVPFHVRPISMHDVADSEASYNLLFGESFEHIRQEFADDIADLVNQCFFGVSFLDGMIASPARYHVGPQAHSFPMWLINLYDDARPFLEDTATLLTLGAAAKALLSRLSQFLRSKQLEINPLVSEPSSLPVVFSETILVGLCASHFIETYDPKGAITLESFSRSPFYGYGDVDHPGGQESYTVKFVVGERLYFYDITNRAKVTNHFSMFNNEVEMLALPVFDGDFSIPAPDPDPVRRITLEFQDEAGKS